uniref:(California timema) hypothetical protein n=1 Tax=Timema californicum TaxID=61474 RepID=A0A7R9PB24_TIMCA|nr:unnamed protein product [Timema californicum]
MARFTTRRRRPARPQEPRWLEATAPLKTVGGQRGPDRRPYSLQANFGNHQQYYKFGGIPEGDSNPDVLMISSSIYFETSVPQPVFREPVVGNCRKNYLHLEHGVPVADTFSQTTGKWKKTVRMSTFGALRYLRLSRCLTCTFISLTVLLRLPGDEFITKRVHVIYGCPQFIVVRC